MLYKTHVRYKEERLCDGCPDCMVLGPDGVVHKDEHVVAVRDVTDLVSDYVDAKELHLEHVKERGVDGAHLLVELNDKDSHV